MSTFNPSDKNGAVTLSGANLVAVVSGTPAPASSVRGTTSKASGKFVIAFTPSAGSDVDNPGRGMGFANASASLGNYVGSDTNSFGFYNDGGDQYYAYDGPFADGLVGNPAAVGQTTFVAIDTGAKLVWRRHGLSGEWNDDPTADPEGASGGIDFSNVAGPYFPLFTGVTSGDGMTLDPTAAGHGLSTFLPWDLTTTTVLRDIGAPTAVQRILARDAGLRWAADAAVLADRPGPVTRGAALAADCGRPALDVGATTRLDASTGIAAMLLQVRDGRAALEPLATVMGEQSISGALVAAQAAELRCSLAALAALQFDASGGLDLGAGVLAEARLPAALLASLDSAAFLPVDWLGSALIVLGDTATPISWLAAIRSDVMGALEPSALTFGSVTPAQAALAGVLADLGLKIAAGARLTRDSAGAYGWSATLDRDAIAGGEAAAMAAGEGASIPLAAGVAILAEMPVQAGQLLTVAGETFAQVMWTRTIVDRLRRMVGVIVGWRD